MSGIGYDLTTLKDAVSIGKDIMLAVVGGLTLLVARKGLNTWERQLKGTSDFELAKRLAKQARIVVAHLQAARSPMIFAWEMPESYRAQMDNFRKIVPSEEEAAARHHVYRTRMKPVIEALQEFELTAIEAEAVWGPAAESAALALRQVVRNVDVMMEAVVADLVSGGQHFKSDPGFGLEARAAVSATPGTKDNKVNQEVKAAIAAVDALAKPHLTSR